MRKCAFVVLISILAVPAFAERQVSVAQLQQVIAGLRNKSDKAAAHRLQSLTLTQRLSSAQLQKWQAMLPGAHSRQALLVLADLSDFRDPPPAQMPSIPAPPIDQQRRLVIRAVRLAANSLHQMPNLTATRDTTQFRSAQRSRKLMMVSIPSNQKLKQLERQRTRPFRQIGHSQTTVLILHGREVTDNQTGKLASPTYSVKNRGAFGNFLRLVIADLLQNPIEWDHWERTPSGRLAVFRFQVPEGKAHFGWTFCKVAPHHPGKKNRDCTMTRWPYLGEIAVNEKTGAIARVTVQTQPRLPAVLQASETVAYGPVRLAGATFLCPLTDVVLYQARKKTPPMAYYSGSILPASGLYPVILPPTVTNVNHSVFTHYHLYSVDVHILPQKSPPNPNHPPSN